MAALHGFAYKITRLAGKDTAKQLIKQHLYNLRITKLISLVGLTSSVLFLHNPTKSFILNRELVSLLPIEITFTDQSKLSGFFYSKFMYGNIGCLRSVHFVVCWLPIFYWNIQLFDPNWTHRAWRQTTRWTLERNQEKYFATSTFASKEHLPEMPR